MWLSLQESESDPLAVTKRKSVTRSVKDYIYWPYLLHNASIFLLILKYSDGIHPFRLSL